MKVSGLFSLIALLPILNAVAMPQSLERRDIARVFSDLHAVGANIDVFVNQTNAFKGGSTQEAVTVRNSAAKIAQGFTTTVTSLNEVIAQQPILDLAAAKHIQIKCRKRIIWIFKCQRRLLDILHLWVALPPQGTYNKQFAGDLQNANKAWSTFNTRFLGAVQDQSLRALIIEDNKNVTDFFNTVIPAYSR